MPLSECPKSTSNCGRREPFSMTHLETLLLLLALSPPLLVIQPLPSGATAMSNGQLPLGVYANERVGEV
jgi:hypothetical protein